MICGTSAHVKCYMPVLSGRYKYPYEHKYATTGNNKQFWPLFPWHVFHDLPPFFAKSPQLSISSTFPESGHPVYNATFHVSFCSGKQFLRVNHRLGPVLLRKKSDDSPSMNVRKTNRFPVLLVWYHCKLKQRRQMITKWFT